jgi:predicted nucleic acid-binding protein
MGADALIDTGAILALLDRTDRWRRACVEVFPEFRMPLATSEAVLTELFPMIGESRSEMEGAWKLLRSGAFALPPIRDSELPEIHALMSRYWDRPMELADATRVHLAKRERISTVYTVDFANFETYRMDGRRRFRVLPLTSHDAGKLVRARRCADGRRIRNGIPAFSRSL